MIFWGCGRCFKGIYCIFEITMLPSVSGTTVAIGGHDNLKNWIDVEEVIRCGDDGVFIRDVTC